jgi:hypothetical protein
VEEFPGCRVCSSHGNVSSPSEGEDRIVHPVHAKKRGEVSNPKRIEAEEDGEARRRGDLRTTAYAVGGDSTGGVVVDINIGLLEPHRDGVDCIDEGEEEDGDFSWFFRDTTRPPAGRTQGGGKLLWNYSVQFIS